ncbi:DNA-binding protein [Flavobacterium beibuense]|uniref:Ciab protein n=1 Tax=Flavobacterium beibuense TaxID=657326 RepID=A0A444WFL0_9FLAO|nr:DNA-binding protein [Flavobacterium beibuense]RYJ44494.1 Ciab protein [Flavobacterium beibuense]
MVKDLTSSNIDRKNILNNNIVIQEVYQQVGFLGIKFEGKYRFTKTQISNFFEVDNRTIDRILENNKEEIQQNGYELYSGNKLKLFKDEIFSLINQETHVHDKNVVNIIKLKEEFEALNKTPQLGVFTYKAFLNIGMLLSNSENAQKLRSLILDIVIDVLNKRLGGKTKYINQREEDFLPSAIREYNYRQEFTNALDFYITTNKFKYSQLTDKIYKSIFKGNSKEYRQILNLSTKESVRNTMYSEVLDLIAAYENGFANFLKQRHDSLERKLSLSESLLLFSEFEKSMQAFIEPLREKARSIMASRDLAFRDALHEKLKEYIDEVSSEDFEKFLGERSMDLEKRLEDNKEVFKRLKER